MDLVIFLFICTYFPWFSMVFPCQTWMDHPNLGKLPQFAALRLRNFSMAEQKGLRFSRYVMIVMESYRSVIIVVENVEISSVMIRNGKHI